jgi:RNA-directed DNA polymerase
MKSILDLDHIKARSFFMESENYCNISLPAYFDFKPLLDYVKSKVGNCKAIESILKFKKKYPSNFDDINYTMQTNKDGRYAFRPLQLVNPYIYYFLVKKITEANNWNTLKNLFCVQNKVPNIEVASIPKVKDYKKKIKRSKYDIEAYTNLFEQRAIELSLSYRYIFVSDITNCYGSIYTHTISWAVHTETVAKQNRTDDSFLGNKIDRIIQSMQYMQTNGIPQGSTLFDFIAEIVLGYADRLLDDELKSKGITDYKILRFRDDYKIFNKDKNELEQISFVLQRVLSHLNMHLNSSKTFISEDVITSSIKQDKYYYIISSPIYHHKTSSFPTIQKELLYIRQFSKKYPNSGQVQTMFSNLQRRIVQKKTNSENWMSIIAILTDMTIDNPKLYSNIMALMSLSLSKIGTKEEQETLVTMVKNRLKDVPNKGILQLWMQRFTKCILSTQLSYEEKLCDIVDGKKDVNLWNLSWIADKFINGLPINNIVNQETLKSQEPVIGLDEFSPFIY